MECRSEADVVEAAFAVLQAKQQRPDQGRVPLVSEAADDTIRCPPLFHLEHRPLAQLVGAVEAFGDDPVEPAAARFEPAPRFRKVAGIGR